MNKDIFYFAENGGEVDFLIKKGKTIVTLLQACYDVESFETKERETKSLLRASEKLKAKDLLVITTDYEDQEKIARKTVKFIPLWKWLLGLH